MGQAKVVPLDVAQAVDETVVGPKAMSLVRMIRAGLATPASFCVTKIIKTGQTIQVDGNRGAVTILQ